MIAWGRRTGSHAVSARQIGARELGGRRIHRKADPAAIKGAPAPVEGRQRRRAQVSRGSRGGIYGSRIGQRGALGVSGKTPGAYPNRRRRAHAAGRTRAGLRRALAGTQRSAHNYHGCRDKRFHPNLRASPCRDMKRGLPPEGDNRIGLAFCRRPIDQAQLAAVRGPQRLLLRMAGGVLLQCARQHGCRSWSLGLSIG